MIHFIVNVSASFWERKKKFGLLFIIFWTSITIFSRSKLFICLWFQIHISFSLSEVGLLTPAWAELDPCIVGRWVGGGEGSLQINADHHIEYHIGYHEDDDDNDDEDNDYDVDDIDLRLPSPLHWAKVAAARELEVGVHCRHTKLIMIMMIMMIMTAHQTDHDHDDNDDNDNTVYDIQRRVDRY